jgi:hypothetical protein
LSLRIWVIVSSTLPLGSDENEGLRIKKRRIIRMRGFFTIVIAGFSLSGIFRFIGLILRLFCYTNDQA